MADNAVIEQPQAPVSAPVEPVTQPTQTPEPASVAEHAERHGPNGTGEPPPPDDGESPLDDVADEDAPQSRSRGSRAKSKMAAARINRLTAEKNELRQRLEALEKAQKPAPVTSRQTVPTLPSVPSVEFNEPEPQLEQFADKEDPYGAWQRALAAYDRRQEAAELQSQHMRAHHQYATQEVQQYYQQVESAHQQRLINAIASNPQAYQALAAAKAQGPLPPLLDWAVMLDNDSADVALFLATHPDDLDDFVSRAVALPPTEQSVALLRRMVRKRMTAETTGTVAPSQPLPNAPRPPIPVRTGTIRTTDEPPSEDVSIADHAKYHMPKRR